MEKKRIEWTRNRKIAAVLALALVGAAFYIHSLGTQVAYVAVTSGAIEQLETVKAKSLPVNPTELAIGQDGVLLSDLPDLGTVVDKGQVLSTFKPLSLASRLSANAQEWISLGDALKLSDESADTGSKLVESYKAWQNEHKVLTEQFAAHASVLELLRGGMVSGSNYSETLEQLNSTVKDYLESTVSLKNTMGEVIGQTTSEKAFEAASGHLEALQNALSLMNNPTDGKSGDLSDLSGQLNIAASKPGVITRTFGKSGTFLPIGTPVVEISDINQTLFSFDLDIDWLKDVKVGTPIRVKDASGKVIVGKVSWIGSQINDQMNSDGSVSKFVSAKALVDNQEKINLYAEASVSIVRNSTENGLIVPKSLLTERDGKWYVRYNDSGVLKEKEVKLAFEVGEQAVLSSGVKAGEKLVVDTSLNPGQRISFK